MQERYQLTGVCRDSLADRGLRPSRRSSRTLPLLLCGAVPFDLVSQLLEALKAVNLKVATCAEACAGRVLFEEVVLHALSDEDGFLNAFRSQYVAVLAHALDHHPAAV